jgi:hypothetical protein
LEHAQPATFDHCRAAHANVGIFGGDHYITATKNRSVAGEAVARIDSNDRDQTTQLGEPQKRQTVQPADTESIGIARPSTTAFGEEDNRQMELLGNLKQTVLFPVILCALCACEHGVVVTHDHRLSGMAGEVLAVHGANATDQPIGWSALDEILDGAPATLRRDHHRAVFDETARIDKVVKILAGGAATNSASASNGVRPGLIQPYFMAGHNFSQGIRDLVNVYILR